MSDDIESATDLLERIRALSGQLKVRAIEEDRRLIRAAERERIAKLCDEQAQRRAGWCAADALRQVARVIRAMGDDK